MAEIRLNYTADQINALLNKISNGEVLTPAEKNSLLNLDLSGIIDDAQLTAKIQNEITKSTAYSALRGSNTRVILGRYIIRYNDLENTLDFSYTDNEIISPNYEVGSISDVTGGDMANTTSIRTFGKIEVDPLRTYTLYFLKPALYVRYFLYQNDGTFIGASMETSPSSNGVVKIETTSNTAFIRFKFSAPEQTVASAFALTDYVDLYKSVGTTVSVPTGYEVGSLNAVSGILEDDNSAVRTANYISIDPNNKYIVTVSGAVKSFRFYFYDANQSFINCTNVTDTPSGGTITATPPSNAAYMKFKFTSSDNDQTNALIIASNLTLTTSQTQDLGISWVQGEYDAYGVAINKDPDYCVRPEQPITIEPGYEYSLTFGGDVVWFRYYFYTSSGTFISRSDSMEIAAGTSITINPPVSAAQLTMKVGNYNGWVDAKAIADDPNTVFKKIER